MTPLHMTDTAIVGPHGELALAAKDAVSRKLLMLLLHECLGVPVVTAAQVCGYSRIRYYQTKRAYVAQGAEGLRTHKPGRKGNTIMTPPVEREVVRHVLLDPQASVAVVTQRLRQQGVRTSQRSVARTIARYGLQKKTLRLCAWYGAGQRDRPRQQSPDRHLPRHTGRRRTRRARTAGG